MKSAREIRLFRTVRIVCAIVFVLFAFTYLSVHQSPLLEVVYDMTATGKLQYDANITSAVITFVLLALTLWINKFAKFNREWEALSYLPASILLAFITDIDRGIYDGSGNYARWIWIAITVILIYCFSSWVLRRVLFMRIKDLTKATNRIMWRNFLLFTIIFSATGFLTRNSEDFKHECMVYHYTKRGELDKAKKVASRSLSASRELTAGRAYILANTGEMGELLFTYPQYYGVDGLLPSSKQTSPITADSICAYLKALPEKGESTIEYFYKSLPFSTREKLIIACDGINEKLRIEARVVAEPVAIDDHTYLARCEIYEYDEPLFKLDLNVGGFEAAKQCCDYFKENNLEIYNKIFKIMFNEEDKE